MEIDIILDRTLRRISPVWSVLPRVRTVVNRIREHAHKHQVKCEVMIGGSIAKDTYLNGSYDCDVFVRFDRDEYKGIDLSAQLDIILSGMKLNYKRVNGSRDYFQFIEGDITYEVIPVLWITHHSQSENVTDMSPYHVSWAKQYTKRKSIRDNIRLLRAFCKAQRIYGAESYIGGFSGHVIDILVIYYGSFLRVLEASLMWKDKEIIDVMDYYKGKDAFEEMNDSKVMSPIIVVDPIMPDRNAASALSYDALKRFRDAAQKFLTKPLLSSFIKTKFTPATFTTKKGYRFAVRVRPKDGKKDVVGAQLVGIHKFILQQAKKFGFTILVAEWEWSYGDDAMLLYLVEKRRLSNQVEIIGPPVRMKEHVAEFMSVHMQCVEKNGRIVGIDEREFKTFDQLLKSVSQNSYVLKKCENVKNKYVGFR